MLFRSNYRGKEDYLSIKKDLKFELKDPTGTDLYLSTFVSWVYNENPVEGTIRFEFLKDGKSCCSFPMNINFKGWRAAWVCYERDMEGTPEEGMNEIRIHAPEGSGSLFFDLMMTAAKTDHRHQTADVQLPFVNEGNHNHWLVVYKNSLIQPNLALTPLTETERKEIKILEQRFKDIIYTKSVLSENTFSKLKEQFEYYQIRYDENGKISGMPLFFGRATEAYERFMDNWSKEK